ncbi:MAG: FHA domain-containing protein [Clostridium perfringens]|nr:FHA domain-containing protein [Clostridium perfringens]
MFSKLMTWVFGIIFIVILYSIIYYALKIMYKDVKGGKKKKAPGKKAHGLEVLKTIANGTLGIGSVIPVTSTISIGRREDNSIVLNDQFVSSYHAKIYVKNNDFYLEDLASTNGTFINDSKVEGRVRLKVNDQIRMGSTVFKVIG